VNVSRVAVAVAVEMDRRVAELVRRELDDEVVISAVDRNSARHAIQDALPRLILGASTNEMRAQVNLYDVIGPHLICLGIALKL